MPLRSTLGRGRPPNRAKGVEYIRDFATSWAKAKPPTKAAMIQSLYQEVVVRGEEFVSVRLTPEADARGLAALVARMP
jgi:hypothetical protein